MNNGHCQYFFCFLNLLQSARFRLLGHKDTTCVCVCVCAPAVWRVVLRVYAMSQDFFFCFYTHTSPRFLFELRLPKRIEIRVCTRDMIIIKKNIYISYILNYHITGPKSLRCAFVHNIRTIIVNTSFWLWPHRVRMYFVYLADLAYLEYSDRSQRPFTFASIARRLTVSPKPFTPRSEPFSNHL